MNRTSTFKLDGGTDLRAHITGTGVSVHLPPLKKGGRGGFFKSGLLKIPPNPPFPKGGTERIRTGWRRVFLAIGLLMLSACTLPGTERGSPAYEKLEPQMRPYGETVEAMRDDTDDPALSAHLQKLDDQFKGMLRKLQAEHGISSQQAGALEEAKDMMMAFEQQKVQAIKTQYDEYTVDFLYLNQWKLLDEAKQKLANIDWNKACTGKHGILIYGYGDPIGKELETVKISIGRASAITNWIIAHSDCKRSQLISRGLGVDVKATVIDAAELAPWEREQLYQRSRYARIFVPK